MDLLLRTSHLIGPIALAATIVVLLFTLVAAFRYVLPGVTGFMVQKLMGVFGLLPKRKKTWGIVYDANSKRPIPFAKVQLLDQNRRVLETHVADRDGRYGFLATPASLNGQNVQVSIVVSHEGYSFPSHTPASFDTLVYNNLYYGGVIEINDQTLINFDIPLDPLKASHRPLYLKSPSIALGIGAAALADVGFWFGIVMAPLAFWLLPNPFTFGVLCVFLGTVSLRVFGITDHPYGVVIDAATGKPMSFALITLNDLTGQRVAFAVSDERGRYFIVAKSGSYEVSVFTPATIVPQRRTKMVVKAGKGWITREIKV